MNYNDFNKFDNIGDSMVDLSKIEYMVIVTDENGKQYNIKDYVENLG